MEKFENNGKLNFVDEFNVVLGFDYSQSCCEYFGWFISDEIPIEFDDNEREPTFDFEPWRFDSSFCNYNQSANGIDMGDMVTFKLVNKDGRKKQPKYLTLFNSHNGYYGHVFELEIGGQEIRSGCL